MKTLVLILSLLVAFPAHAQTPSQGLAAVTVLADKSLTEPMVVLVREYARDSDVAVNTVFGETPELRRRIEGGEAADVFIAASASALEKLERQGMIDVHSRAPFARVPLALIAQSAYSAELAPKPGIPSPELTAKLSLAPVFLLANPDLAIEGNVGRHALQAFGWWPQITPIIRYVDSLQVAEEVGRHQSALGLTSAAHARGLGIRVLGTLPETPDLTIAYHVAVVAGERMAAARRFVEYLHSAKALAILKTYGYERPQ